MSAFRNIRSPRFRQAVIRDKTEVYRALRAFFSQERPAAARTVTAPPAAGREE